MLQANYHTHTTMCDGTSTAEEMANRALELGFSHLGFSGHMDPDIHMDWASYTSKIGELAAALAGRLDILCGVELDNLYDPACCPGAEYAIISTHFLPIEAPQPMSVDNTPEMLCELCRNYYGGDWYKLTCAYFDFEAQVFDRLRTTTDGPKIVGHFDLVSRFNDQLHTFDETDPRYLGPAYEAMSYLVEEGVAFEINCGAINRGRKAEPYPRHELLRFLSQQGGEIFISSDAHQAELLNGGFDVAIQMAIEAGFTHVNILVHEIDGSVGSRSLPLDTL